MSVESYRDLRVWQRRLDLVHAVYDITRRLPPDERGDLLIVQRIGYSDAQPLASALAIGGEVGRMLRMMRVRLRESPPRAPR
jgi:hypothetical protein